MRLIKIKEMSAQGAILTAGLMVSVSIFLTTWFFFGGVNNKTKIFLDNPQRNVQQNAAAINQARQIQQQRVLNTSETPVTKTVPPSTVATTTKTTKTK